MAMDYRYVKNEQTGEAYIEVSVTDYGLINHPLLNKGMAFSNEERETFNLLGLLPPHVTNMATQRERSYAAFKSKATDLERYIYLRDLQNSNETLFYNLLITHIEEMLPIVYTPTVGLGCQQFSHIYRRPRGAFIAYPYKEKIDKILSNRRFDRVKAIVVTDGERILGLGDQGAGGMGIPIGKLSLYIACAGIHPTQTLPILLDTGTNNEDLIKDPLYIGWRHERLRGQEYDDFIDAFVNAVKKRFPHVLLQWEDFAQANANPLLQRYRNALCTFNDDIQGTAAVATGAILAAVKMKKETLAEQRIVIVGAGSAGCGIAELLLQALLEEGLSRAQAKERLYLVDRYGLLLDDTPNLQPFQQKFTHSRARIHEWTLSNTQQIMLEDVVHNLSPTILIGVSGQTGIFTEKIVRKMAEKVKYPVIFPLSNPQSKCEAEPANLLAWTNDNAIIGTGSPYAPIMRQGKLFHIAQTNNCYVFPGLGLGLIAVKAKYASDRMFMVAAKALAASTPDAGPNGNVLPPLSHIRDVSLNIALAVAEEAIQSGLAQYIPTLDLKTYIHHYMWQPVYLPYKKMEEK